VSWVKRSVHHRLVPATAPIGTIAQITPRPTRMIRGNPNIGTSLRLGCIQIRRVWGNAAFGAENRTHGHRLRRLRGGSQGAQQMLGGAGPDGCAQAATSAHPRAQQLAPPPSVRPVAAHQSHAGCGNEAKHTAVSSIECPQCLRAEPFGACPIPKAPRARSPSRRSSVNLIGGVIAVNDGQSGTKPSAPYRSHPRTARHQLQSANLRVCTRIWVCIAPSRPAQAPLPAVT